MIYTDTVPYVQGEKFRYAMIYGSDPSSIYREIYHTVNEFLLSMAPNQGDHFMNQRRQFWANFTKKISGIANIVTQDALNKCVIILYDKNNDKDYYGHWISVYIVSPRSVGQPEFQNQFNSSFVTSDALVYKACEEKQKGYDRDCLKALNLMKKLSSVPEVPGVRTPGAKADRKFSGLIGGHRIASAPAPAKSGWSFGAVR
ncbi:hypothetical protein IY145_09010 [Methylosinus sp. H3A]|uniref:hypothetical protein n=1 Tax=Methylosinus sp. H3A TaxID=2785786 RepID=UPI0018C2ADA3|nr:hypothetical protein [Methylosinus sp. H3A]MBG0809518.1 hypothetical protein [Methylosinus sp. H3A]